MTSRQPFIQPSGLFRPSLTVHSHHEERSWSESVAAREVAQDSEDGQEQVDQVEVDPECKHDGVPLGGRARVNRSVYVVDDVAREDRRSGGRDEQSEERQVHEDADYAGDYDADQREEEDRAEAREVAVGRVAVVAGAE